MLVMPLQASGPLPGNPGPRLAPGILRDPARPDRLRLTPALPPGQPNRLLPRAMPPARYSAAEPLLDLDPLCGTGLGTPFGPARLWARGDYLLWWTRGTDLPDLVTDGTDVLYGGETRLDQLRAGGRFRLGWWLDPCQTRGVEFTYLGLIGSSDRFFVSSDDSPTLLRPFFLPTGVADNLQVANPAYLDGTIAIDLDTRFQSLDVAWRRVLFDAGDRRLDLLLGYRYAGLQEDLQIDQQSTFTAGRPPIAAGTVLTYSDEFRANNVFNGGQLGLVYQVDRCVWHWEVLARVALGNTATRVNVDGQTNRFVPDFPLYTIDGGLLAQPTNIDQFDQNRFSVIPEIGVNVSYDLTCRLRASIGYSFLAWTQVMRPADQIDTTVDRRHLEGAGAAGGAVDPAFPDNTTTFWAQGAQIGLEYRW